jgi:hypothetical protein
MMNCIMKKRFAAIRIFFVSCSTITFDMYVYSCYANKKKRLMNLATKKSLSPVLTGRKWRRTNDGWQRKLVTNDTWLLLLLL